MKYIKYLLPIALISLFLFLRFYNIKNGLFFFNDMGRDLLVLQNWQLSGKPPLLGPQTSVLPFNQSSIYFYYLYIFYLITKGSVFSALFANAFLYIAMYIFGLYIFKKDKKITNLLNIAFFLISIHPQYIIQSRFVWNPSLVTPFILSSFFAFHLLNQKYSKSRLWFFSLSIATAISISYSVIPLFIALIFYWLIFNRKNFWKLFISISISLLTLNLTTIIFELRHNFLLTRSILTRPPLPQLAIGFYQKFSDLSRFVVNTSFQNTNQIILLFFVFLSIFLIIKGFKSTSRQKNIDFFINTIFFFTFLTYMILPVSIQAHYVFPQISLLFLVIATLPIKKSLVIILILSFIYLSPSNLTQYFQKAPRTYAQMEKCFIDYCKINQEPINVAVTIDKYTFIHNGPEHRYLLKKTGCDVKNLEEGQKTKKMALVLDSGSFDPVKSKFYELDLFGPYKIGDTYNCLSNFKIINLLSK